MKRLWLIGAAILASVTVVSADITGIVTTPGGTTGSVQINRRGALFGDSQFTYSTSTYNMTVPSIAVGTVTINGVTYQWPTTPGTSGQVLQGDGTGRLTWQDNTATVVSTTVALGIFEESTQISSTTSVLKFDTTPFSLSFLAGATAYVSLDQNVVGFLASTQTYTAPHSFTNATTSPAITVTSTGTGNGMRLVSNAVPSGGLQNSTGGALNIRMNAVGEGLIIYSSVTDSQQGSSFLRIQNDAPLYNDPLLWIEDRGAESNPAIRIDSYAPDIEMVNESTTTAQGLGKWEPAAIPYQGTQLQINSRANDNSTFERVAEWRMRQKGGGLALYPSVLGENGNPTATTTGKLIWITTDSVREVGLRGPTSASASWYWTLPSTFNNAGQLMYQSTNGPDRQLAFTTATASNFTPLINQGTAAPIWSSSITVTQINYGLANNSVALGQGSLAAFTTSSISRPNVAIGPGALTNVTTGGGNTAGGYATLGNITTQNYNSGFGDFAGTYLTNGDYNIFFGYGAGHGAGGSNLLDSGNGNIMIGQYTGPTSLLAHQDNSISLGNFANANCSNCMTIGPKDDSITAYTRLSVGISTDTPRERLHLGSGNLRLDASGAVKFYDSDSSNFAALKSSDSMSADVTWSLPAAEGIAGQTLATDGAGAWFFKDSGTNWVNVKTSTYSIRNDGQNITASMTAGDNLVTADASVFSSADVGKLIGVTNASSSTLAGLYITASSWTVTRTSGTWSQGDVGRSITISTAGVAGGVLSSTIVRFTSGTQVDIADLAGTTVSNGLGTKADMLATTISSYVSGTQVRVALNAAFTASSTTGYFGTDNTTPIQNILNAYAGGGTLYFPKGIYLVKSASNVSPALSITSASNLTLLGEKGSTIQATYNSPYNLFEATRSSDITFRGLTIDGGYPYLDPNTFNTNAINYVYNSINLTVEDCTFQNINDTAIADRSFSMLSAQYANTTTNKKSKAIITGNRFYNVHTGFNTKQGSRWGIISNNIFEEGECAAKIDGELPGGQTLGEKSSNWTISHNIATKMGKAHTTSTGVFELEENIENIILTNNIISSGTVDCLKINGGQTIKDSYSLDITGNICSGMKGFGIAIRPDGGGASTSTIRSVNISNNLFREIDKANIYFNFNSSGTVENISINNNQFVDWNKNDQVTGTAEGGIYVNNTGPIKALSITNNSFLVTGSPAVADSAGIVWATTNVSSYTITRNRMENTSNTKLLVQVNAGSSDLVLDGNSLNTGRINALGNLTLRNHLATDSPVVGFNSSTITVENSRFIKGAATNALSSTSSVMFKEYNVLYEGFTSTYSLSGGAYRADVDKQYAGGTSFYSSNSSGPVITASVSGTSPAFKSDGTILVKSIGAAPTALSGYSILFSSSSPAEMFVMDASGNATQISPHDSDNRWVYESVNQRLNKSVYIPMEDFFEVMESVLNRKLIFRSRDEYLDYRNKTK